ncbi:MAG TPA: sensor histidine kinase [Oscillospiraceae bacterium]|nr:sensor histidine kinase [Oscillospiraceae bacterium]
MKSTIDYLAAALALICEPAALAAYGRIVYLNPPAMKLTGREKAEFPAEALLPAHVVNCQAASFVTGGAVAGQRCAIRADTVEDVRVYFFTPDAAPSVPGLHAALPKLRQELLNLKLASDRIVAMAAGSGDEKYTQYSAVLAHSYYELKRLVQNISVLEGLMGGELPFSPAACDLGELCGDLASAAAPFAARSGVELRFDRSGELIAAADSELIELLVLNLLANSFSHTPAGGVVKLSVSDYPGGVMIAVTDTGGGIDPEIMKSVFSRYSQSLSLSDMAEGAGLGLTIARGVAEKHGGALILESRAGCGASVRASVSKELLPAERFRAAEAAYAAKGMDLLLTQLSPWLSPDCYAYEYDE